jgi:hypothetical protein
MKKMIVACMVFFVSSFLFSYEYLMNTNPLGIGSHTGYNLITTLTGGNWDDGYYDLAIPEANKFYYYGKKVTHLRISTNGYVVLGFGSATGNGTLPSNQSIPNPAADNNIVAPLWDDYVLAAGGGVGDIYYEFVTNANNNNHISVEWRGVRRAGSTDTAYSFSCAFYGANNGNYANSIAFVYADVDSGNATYDNGKSATVGIENSTGTQGAQYSCNEAIVSNGRKILFTPFVPIYGSTTDIYPGVYDGKPDAVVFRPSNGYWYYYNSDGSQRSFEYGQKGDVALPGDYGAGFSLECVFRPDNGHWYCRIPYIDIKWGTSGDIPVPADYDGDGSLDIAVFRPSNGTWYVYIRGTGTIYSWQWGQPGDIPLPADYDNDNYADLAVFRPANSTWYIRKSSDWSMVEKKWGTEGDVPMPTNIYFMIYSTMTVFRPSNGFWYTLNQQTGDIRSGPWGQDGDVPVPADENAGGNTDVTVFRPENGYWYIVGSPSGGLPASFQWGQLGDQPRFRCSFLVVSPPPAGGSPSHCN